MNLLFKDNLPLFQENATRGVASFTTLKDLLSGSEREDRKSTPEALVSSFRPLHTTTSQKAVQILESGQLKSHRVLSRERHPAVANRLKNATDALDMKHGLDEYVFFSVGRTLEDSEFPDNEVYFSMKESIYQIPHSLVSFKEIAELGGLVSPEATWQAILNGRCKSFDEAEKRNLEAYRRLLGLTVLASDFPHLFIEFLTHFYKHPVEYILAPAYPGEKLEIENARGSLLVVQRSSTPAIIRNIWQWPQLCIPESVSLGGYLDSIICIRESSQRQIRDTLNQIPSLSHIPVRTVASILREQEIPPHPLTRYFWVQLASALTNDSTGELGSVLREFCKKS